MVGPYAHSGEAPLVKEILPGTEIWWWRKVTSSIEFPYRGVVLKLGEARISVQVDDPAAEGRPVRRWVSPLRVQTVEGYCACSTQQEYPSGFPLHDWGRFTRYLDIASDLRPIRHVDVFENGRTLRYDRGHWCDEFGMLADMQSRRNLTVRHWGAIVEIPVSEFDAIWSRAGTNEFWPRQLASSRSGELGDTPLWFKVRGWRPPALQ